MHYMTVVSLEMSDEPKKFRWLYMSIQIVDFMPYFCKLDEKP